MKTIGTILMTALVSIAAYAGPNGNHPKEVVPNRELMRNWELGQTKHVEDAEITRLNGDGVGVEQTNIMVTGSIEQTIHLFLSREKQDGADLSNYSLLLHSADGVTPLYKMNLGKQTATRYKDDVYYNYMAMEMPKELPKEYMLTVWEHASGKTTTYYIATNSAEQAQ